MQVLFEEVLYYYIVTGEHIHSYTVKKEHFFEEHSVERSLIRSKPQVPAHPRGSRHYQCLLWNAHFVLTSTYMKMSGRKGGRNFSNFAAGPWLLKGKGGKADRVHS